MVDKKVGIVLSSGGGRGVFGHTGFLCALDKLGVKIHAMSGCSAGAVVGSIAASGGNLRAWRQAISKIEMKQFWRPISTAKLLYKLIVGKGKGLVGLSKTDSAIRFISRYLGTPKFEECKYPFYVVAVNIGNGNEVIFDSEELAPRVMASAAIPVFYEPVKIGDEYFSDGATVDFIPTGAICCKHKLDLVIIHHLANRDYTLEQLRKSFKNPWSIADILYRLIFHQKPWYGTGQQISHHECPCGCDAEIVVIEPKLPDLAWPVTTGGIEIIAAAEEQAYDSLNKLFRTSISDLDAQIAP